MFEAEVEYLERIVVREGMKVSKGSIETMENWQAPTNTKEVERLCGFANYHRCFIKDIAELSAPLYGLTGKNRFHWEPEHQDAFDN